MPYSMASEENFRKNIEREAAGAEVLSGDLRKPVHVLEGSIDFRILGPTPSPATGAKYGIVWWGVEAGPE